MVKIKHCIPIGLGVVLSLSSAKNDNSEQLMRESLSSIYGAEMLDGRQLPIDSLSGRMVLLNFWASYDAESRINNYRLVDMSERYGQTTFCRGNGLKVVSISLDRFRSPLRKAISMDGTQDFYHICDFKGKDSDILKDFGVSSPINILIDADGNVVSRDFELENIESTLNLLAENK